MSLITVAPTTIHVVRMNGSNGFKALGRRAKDLRTAEQFKAFRSALAFPKEMLHPSIAQRAWISVMRNEFDVAVMFSSKAVEIAVRQTGQYPETDIGVPLMTKAFNPENGRLTRQADPAAEREALMRLFAGAIGSYKNPHSHRNVELKDAAEAQEMVMLASHLLRIVDSRRRSQSLAVKIWPIDRVANGALRRASRSNASLRGCRPVSFESRTPDNLPQEFDRVRSIVCASVFELRDRDLAVADLDHCDNRVWPAYLGGEFPLRQSRFFASLRQHRSNGAGCGGS